jgi:dTDP-glucose pyrophosphorylase
MSYRVFIPCAGSGTRLGDLTTFLNKSLVSIANRPAISHLIEQFPIDTEFVIALGYKGQLVRDFIDLAYPARKFFFTEVQPFEGPGSGLGLSLASCKEYLQQPFIFTSCDTLVSEKIPPPDNNWMGWATVSDANQYRTVTLNNSQVTDIFEKSKNNIKSRYAYIGLAGINNYKEFWEAIVLGDNLSINIGEALGLKSLINGGYKIQGKQFTWFDTGNLASLKITREAYQEPNSPNILEKSNEAIWFIGDQVIKYSDDQNFISNRTKRAAQLQGFIPRVSGSRANMYRYSKVQGSVLSDVITLPLFNRLLEYCTSFWIYPEITEKVQLSFKVSCRKFYRDKTFERVEQFYKVFDKTDETQPINGVVMPTLQSLLEELDWNWLSEGTPSRFHGDFHFENILWDEREEKFTFLDWRQDFAGDLNVGDLYYDLAKLLHGLIVNHGLIAQNNYSVIWTSSNINFELHRLQILVECEKKYEKWLEEVGYDKKKVWVLTALIFLNIAPLHHHPYSLLLYSLGKSILKDAGDSQ